MKTLTERAEIKNWYENWNFHRPVFLTGVLNDYLGFGKGEFIVDGIIKTNRHFLNELHRRVYIKSKKKIGRLIVIENKWGRGRLHTHMILETPIHLSSDEYKILLQLCWLKTRDGVSSRILSEDEVFDEGGLKDYLSKEFSSESMTGVDVKNSYIQEV